MEFWQAELIESLEQASDIERQRTAWIGSNAPDVPDPVELICQIFDDTAVGDLLEKGAVFSEATDAALRRLRSLAAELDLNLAPDALLSSAGWLEFAREARRTLVLLKEDLA